MIFLTASLGSSSPRNSFDDDDVRSGSFEKHIKPDESISIKTLIIKNNNDIIDKNDDTIDNNDDVNDIIEKWFYERLPLTTLNINKR